MSSPVPSQTPLTYQEVSVRLERHSEQRHRVGVLGPVALDEMSLLVESALLEDELLHVFVHDLQLRLHAMPIAGLGAFEVAALREDVREFQADSDELRRLLRLAVQADQSKRSSRIT